MKILSRDFTLKEKILLLILVGILLLFVYYKLVDEPIRNTVQTSENHIKNLYSEQEILQTRMTMMRNQEAEVRKIKESKAASKMESYNASKAEIDFLNSILEDVVEYNITFSDAESIGNQVRRGFSLKYSTSDYAKAQEILFLLYSCPYRCLIENVKFADRDNNEDIKDGPVEVTLTAKFYETLSGGVVDDGLIVVE